MDHVINGIQSFLEISIDQVREEWNTKNYKKLSECPSYEEAKAMVDAIHRLEKYQYGKNVTMSVKEQVMW